ncbi:unnamed protein product, partial [Rotaria sp. Silwood2]
ISFILLAYVEILLDVLILYFVIKRDRIGILIFAWFKLASLIMLFITTVYLMIIFFYKMAKIGGNGDTYVSTSSSLIDKAMPIVVFIVLIAWVWKVFILYFSHMQMSFLRLSKSFLCLNYPNY